MITFSKLGQYGRLGNQLWQIASTLGIAHYYNTEVRFPYWNYIEKFSNLNGTVWDNDFRSLFSNSKIRFGMAYNEPSPYFIMPIISPSYDWDLEGYFQSYKYFEDIKPTITKIFNLITRKVFLYNRVSIHVRRGDYLSLQHIHPVLPMKYYQNAMQYFSKDTIFAIFSDDIAWCRENFIGDQYEFYDYPELMSLQWMASCSHNIIANSSFSWWAAYLNKNPNKIVVAPKVWVNNESHTNDRIPPEWIRV